MDDEPMVRKLLRAGLAEDSQIEVVGEAGDPYSARDKLVELRPDVMTLDVEMPRMNGLDFLRKLMPQFPLPVIMVSSLTQQGKNVTLECLKAGALDFVSKPTGMAGGYELMMGELREKIHTASRVDIQRWMENRRLLEVNKPVGLKAGGKRKGGIELIAVGASTGGTTALSYILQRLPEDTPGMVVVQHMPSGFTQTYAASLNKQVLLDVKEAETGDLVLPGRVLIAPGDMQMAVKAPGGDPRISIFEYEKVSGHRPSVDVLFNSLAEAGVARKTLGLILTGMGKDGASGLLSLRQKGARTMGQDESSSVVYGMPRSAREMGAVEIEAALADIPDYILKMLAGSGESKTREVSN